MKIKRLEIYKGDVEFTVDFNDNLNIINVANNQFGKTTIIYSILYALGSKEEIWDAMTTVPDLITLVVDDFKIVRSKDFWTINEKSTMESKLTETILSNFPQVRSISGKMKSANFLSILSRFVLIQRRESAKNTKKVFPWVSNTENKDTEMILSNFSDSTKLLALLSEQDRIKSENDKIKKNINLSKYVLKNETDEIEYHNSKIEYEKIENSVIKLNSERRKNFFKIRENAKIIENFKRNQEYIDSVNDFIENILNKSAFRELQNIEEAKDVLWKELGADIADGISISEFEVATNHNIELSSKNKNIEEEIISLENQAKLLTNTKGFSSKILKEAISFLTSDNVIDLQKINDDVNHLKKERDKHIDNIEALNLKKMRELNIEKSDSGIAQMLLHIITAQSMSSVFTLPIIIDSANEPSEIENFNSIVIPLLKESKGQVIITTTKFEGEKDNVVKNLSKRIFD